MNIAIQNLMIQIQKVAREVHQRAGGPIRDNNSGFLTRAGNGRRTYHAKKGNMHTLTFGIKLIDDHFSGDVRGWKHLLEITDYGFFGGLINTATAISHIILHEYAHALQKNAGLRVAGSVHNRAFYLILRDLHARHGAFVLSEIEATIGRLGLPMALSEKKSEEPAKVQPSARAASGSIGVGSRVQFTTRSGDTVRGRIIRRNQKSFTVIPEQGTGKWRVSHHIVEPVNDSNSRQSAA
jgi:hypothetical protein